ncbi:hypothetical protein BDR03DRAFT_964258 [Suillus americanus]|nr:hypothetical protein BDR03DRAFT_964258 [Suillus americanus]
MDRLERRRREISVPSSYGSVSFLVLPPPIPPTRSFKRYFRFSGRTELRMLLWNGARLSHRGCWTRAHVRIDQAPKTSATICCVVCSGHVPFCGDRGTMIHPIEPPLSDVHHSSSFWPLCYSQMYSLTVYPRN